MQIGRAQTRLPAGPGRELLLKDDPPDAARHPGLQQGRARGEDPAPPREASAEPVACRWSAAHGRGSPRGHHRCRRRWRPRATRGARYATTRWPPASPRQSRTSSIGRSVPSVQWRFRSPVVRIRVGNHGLMTLPGHTPAPTPRCPRGRGRSVWRTRSRPSRGSRPLWPSCFLRACLT